MTYEYTRLVLTKDKDTCLNEYGKAGWRVVDVHHTRFYGGPLDRQIEVILEREICEPSLPS